MHAFVWGEADPGFARAPMPTACLTLAIDAIKTDPAYEAGEYMTRRSTG